MLCSKLCFGWLLGLLEAKTNIYVTALYDSTAMPLAKSIKSFVILDLTGVVNLMTCHAHALLSIYILWFNG
jgi:hypothetical protein